MTGFLIAAGICLYTGCVFCAGYVTRGWEWPTHKDKRETMFRSMDQENQSLRRELTKALNQLHATEKFRVIS